MIYSTLELLMLQRWKYQSNTANQSMWSSHSTVPPARVVITGAYSCFCRNHIHTHILFYKSLSNKLWIRNSIFWALSSYESPTSETFLPLQDSVTCMWAYCCVVECERMQVCHTQCGSYTISRLTYKANSSVAVAHVLSKVLKIEPALFPGNRSYAAIMFYSSLGWLSHPDSLVLKNKNCTFEKRERYIMRTLW